MPDPLTTMMLVLALAAGLGAAIVVAQHVQTGRAEFHRYFLTHILLFNLLILAGLVFRFMQPRPELNPAVVPLVLVVMAALKLGWLFAFSVTARLLYGQSVPGRFPRDAGKAGLMVLAAYVAATWMAWFGRMPVLLNAAVITLESIVLGGAVLAAALLLRGSVRLPRGTRRRAAQWFGAFHLALLLAVLAALAASWIRPGSGEAAQVWINGVFLLLFNLFPPLWIRRYRPAPPETVSDRFEALGITRREKEIILLIQEGRTNKEIADQLFISIATVKDHNNNLFRKCGVRNRVELANLFRL